jgi:hypothetical protein
MSSLLEPDRQVTGRYFLDSKYDVVSTATVPTLPLDEAASRYGFPDATFVKLDTQGTELEILQSGARLLEGPLLGIHTEASFHAFYKGQALFADVDRYLRECGFSLFSLNRTLLRRAGYQKELYSQRVVAWAHCLYFREPQALLAAAGDRLRAQMTRLLGLAMAFRFYDVAFEIVEIIANAAMLDGGDVTTLREEIAAFCGDGTGNALQQAGEKGGGDPRARSAHDERFT